jgi:outer membrane autotransporter protein
VIVGRDGTFTGNGMLQQLETSGNETASAEEAAVLSARTLSADDTGRQVETTGGNLIFHGTLVPGLRSQPGSALLVERDVTGDGTLLMHVSLDGTANQLRAGGTVRLDGSRIALGGLPGGAMPATSYDLVHGEEGITGTPANTTATTLQGVTLQHDYRLDISDGDITARLAGSQARPQAKALSEGAIAGLALLGSGANLAAGQGIDAAREAVAGPEDNAGSPVVGAFGALSVGNGTYETGSRIEVTSLSLATGLAMGSDIPLGRLVLGAFLEIGQGSYDTHNSFGAQSLHGQGHANYAGGGVLASLDCARIGTGHPHAEASFRMGRVRNAYGNADLQDYEGRDAEFDGDTPYHGWHAGAGYAWDVTEALSLDMYGRYLLTRTYGESVTLSTGDPVTFDDAVSSRTRVGARMAWEAHDVARPYAGLAWEHEFDGRQCADVHGHDIGVPSMRGDTGIAEAGLSIRPSAGRPLTVDLAAQGYAGTHQGVSGTLQLRLEF